MCPLSSRQTKKQKDLTFDETRSFHFSYSKYLMHRIKIFTLDGIDQKCENTFVLVKMDYPPKGNLLYPPISLHSPSFSLQKEEKTKKKKSEKEEK